MFTQEPYFAHFSSMCKIIVNPIRIRIIDILRDRRLNVSEIQAELTISMSNLSNHLNALFQAGVLDRCKQGSYIYYSLSEPELPQVLERMQHLITAMAERRNRSIMDGRLHP